MKSLRLLAFAFAALVLTSALSWAGDPTGTWKFKVQTPKGRTLDATLVLKLENGSLTGEISNAAGTTAISDAKFTDDQLSFTVVRKLRRREVTTHYTGKLEGDTIKGSIEAEARAKTATMAWDAARQK